MILRDRVAVFIDGENLSHTHAAKIMEVAQSHGRVDLCRVYDNAELIKGWADQHGFRLMHAGSGKNASDLLLTVDAVELALNMPFATVVLASSDGDFSHLAIHLRERGIWVEGLGETKTTAFYRQACSSFHEIKTVPQPMVAPPVPIDVPKASPIDQKIVGLIAAQGAADAQMPLTQLSTAMHRVHQIKISDQPEKTWRAYLINRPKLFDLDPRGPKACVSLPLVIAARHLLN